MNDIPSGYCYILTLYLILMKGCACMCICVLQYVCVFVGCVLRVGLACMCFMHFCPGTMTTHAESINLDLQRELDRGLRHIHNIEHRTEPDSH